jgi:hypothetical protein
VSRDRPGDFFSLSPRLLLLPSGWRRAGNLLLGGGGGGERDLRSRPRLSVRSSCARLFWPARVGPCMSSSSCAQVFVDLDFPVLMCPLGEHWFRIAHMWSASPNTHTKTKCFLSFYYRTIYSSGFVQLMLDLGRREFAKPLVCLGQLDAGFHNLWLATNYFSVSIAQLPIDFFVRTEQSYVCASYLHCSRKRVQWSWYICSAIGIQKHESAGAAFFYLTKRIHYPNNGISFFEGFN